MRRTSWRADGVISPASLPSRSSSISSSITSPHSKYNRLYSAPAANPPPAYISQQGAYETIASSYNDKSSVDDEEPVQFSEGAVSQINAFLDYLLYNFLSTARSSTLAQIRPAVATVVRGRLAAQAIASGDEELSDLLDGAEDDDEIAVARKEKDPSTTWELEPVWKRTRLRIMVYVRLGDMEDDDEERYVEEEQLHNTQEASEHRFSQRSGLVSWAALIFLTAVLELIAERTVEDAVHFASARVSVSRPHLVYEDDDNSGTEPVEEPLMIKEQDVRKLGLSPTLGRIWRTWKKSTPKASPLIHSSVWRHSGRDHRLSQTVSDLSSSDGRRTARSTMSTNDDLREVDDQKQVDEVTALDDATRRASLLRGVGVRRSTSFMRFPIATPNAQNGSWKSRSRRPVQPMWPKRARSSSLPTPATGFWNPPPFSVEEAKVDAPVKKDEQAEASGEGEGDARAPVEENEKDMVAVKETGEDVNEDKTVVDEEQTIEDREEAPSPRVDTGAPTAASDDRSGGTFLEEPGSAITAEESDERDVAMTSEAQAQEEPAPQPQVSPEDDEYDPFRADLAPPPPRSTTSKTPSPSVSQLETPVETEPKPFDRAAPPPASEPHDQGTSAAMVAGAASTAILGSSAAQMRKKERSMDNVHEQHEVRTITPPVTPPNNQTASQTQDSTMVSPLKMNAVKPSDLEQQPSPSTHQATTSDSSSQYATPPRSPAVSPVTSSNAVKTQSNEMPTLRKKSSPPAAPPKPSSDPRRGPTGAGQALNKIITNGSASKESNTSAGSTSEKDFNSMVEGNETVKRSLTPRNLVELESPESPRNRQGQYDQTKNPRLKDAPHFVSKSQNTYTSQPMRRKEELRPNPQPFRTGSKGTKSGLLARDARVQTAPTSELADYLRSTAPSKPQPEPVPFVPSKSLTGKSTTTAGQTNNQIRGKNSNELATSRVGPLLNKTKGLAGPRTARLERQANEELITFLNAGPPGAQVSKKRSVETTYSKSEYPMTVSSANRSSSQTSQSYQDSINSHSALVNKMPTNGQKQSDQRTPGSTPSNRATAGNKGAGEGPPTRKQRRVKDPYAIESDDESEDILTGLPQHGEQGGESLMDFLRNSGPESKLAAAARQQPLGTSSTASGGPYSNKHVPIAANRDLAAQGGQPTSTSSPALPEFLRDSRTSSSRTSVDEGSRKGISRAIRSSESKGGMKSFFMRKKTAMA